MKKENKNQKSQENYLDKVPVIQKKWEVNEKGLVEVTVENTGFFNVIAQKVFKKPRYSFIELDEFHYLHLDFLVHFQIIVFAF